MSTLRDYIRIKHGYAFKGQNISTIDNNVVLVTPGNFSVGGGFKEDKCKYFDAEYPYDYVLKEDDLIVTMTDLSKSIDTLGYSALVPTGKNRRVYLHNQRIGLVTINSDELNKHYIYWFMRSPYYQKMIAATSTGSTVHHTSPDRILDVEIELPKLEDQNKIAAFLDNIENRIQLNNEINNNLEQQVSALYESWFEDFDPTNGVCPDNWSNQMLSTIADISSGKRPPIKSEVYSKETPISIVGAASVMGFTSEANHTDKILVTGRVGTHGVIQRFNTPCWTSDNTLVITSPFYEFTNQILHRIDYSSMNRGSTQPLITQGDMKKVVVLVPDEEILAKFEALAGSLMAQWEANNNENVRLTSLIYTLLPKIMSGKLDVSNIDF